MRRADCKSVSARFKSPASIALPASCNIELLMPLLETCAPAERSAANKTMHRYSTFWAAHFILICVHSRQVSTPRRHPPRLAVVLLNQLLCSLELFRGVFGLAKALVDSAQQVMRGTVHRIKLRRLLQLQPRVVKMTQSKLRSAQLVMCRCGFRLNRYCLLKNGHSFGRTIQSREQLPEIQVRLLKSHDGSGIQFDRLSVGGNRIANAVLRLETEAQIL